MAAPRHHRHRPRCPLGFAFLGVAAGIIADHYGMAGRMHPWWVAIFFFGWWIAYRWSWRVTSRVLLLGVAFVCGAIAHDVQWRVYPKDELGLWIKPEGRPVVVRLQVLDHPRFGEYAPDPLAHVSESGRTRCLVRVLAIKENQSWRPASGRGRMTVQGQLPGINPGDCVVARAWVTPPAPPRNPGEIDFAFLDRCERRLFALRVDHPQAIELSRRASRWDPRWWISRFRGASEHRLRQLVAGEPADLSAALLLGAQECVERDAMDGFLATGTVHLLSISGLHVMILAVALRGLLDLCRWSWRRQAWTVVVVMVLYAALTGGRAPIVRAAVLLSVWALETMGHRPRNPLNSLAAAGLLVLALNPTQLFQIGAQLSFL
ncbi:MAG TPA: ComEC/Rec2 family competence protein, partial [Pirellulaceae bacterium]